jgi:hypothetical protein
MHRALTLGDLGSRTDLSERTKAALFLIFSAFLAGQATAGQFQPEVFTPEVTADAVDLIAAMVEDLPRLTASLGWSQESTDS